MSGTRVSARRSCSASLGSGTARKRASVAISAVGSRKPKIAGAPDDPDAFPSTLNERLESMTAVETSAAEKNLMRLSPGKVSKVAQASQTSPPVLCRTRSSQRAECAALHQFHQLVIH